jgi:hypothetical protein
VSKEYLFATKEYLFVPFEYLFASKEYLYASEEWCFGGVGQSVIPALVDYFCGLVFIWHVLRFLIIQSGGWPSQYPDDGCAANA